MKERRMTEDEADWHEAPDWFGTEQAARRALDRLGFDGLAEAWKLPIRVRSGDVAYVVARLSATCVALGRSAAAALHAGAGMDAGIVFWLMEGLSHAGSLVQFCHPLADCLRITDGARLSEECYRNCVLPAGTAHGAADLQERCLENTCRLCRDFRRATVRFARSYEQSGFSFLAEALLYASMLVTNSLLLVLQPLYTDGELARGARWLGFPWAWLRDEGE